MSEKPLDRLNYFNGQRLEASDLKLEQDYHIRVRRWLNKSLYSSGIARGLEVVAEKGAPRVVVRPGLALDAEGHEIILWDETRIDVCRIKPRSSNEATVDGLYLTIRYNEEVTAVETDGCDSASNGCGPAPGRAAWGGPTRVRAKPLFCWREFLPSETSGEVVLALVELNETCSEVHQIDHSARRYVGAASAAKVRQYALEGERHVDATNPGHVYFHIRGRQPNSVTLYLRSELFSSLYYTELGEHEHAIQVNVNSVTIPSHSHDIKLLGASGWTGDAGSHSHDVDDIRANISGVLAETPLTKVGACSPNPPGCLSWGFSPLIVEPTTMRQASLKTWASMTTTLNNAGTHSHAIPGSTETEPAKTIALSGTGSSSAAGVSDRSARTGQTEKALTYVDDLQVLIGPDVHNLTNCTPDILRQLRAARPPGEDWGKLGEGSMKPNHPLIEKGTRDIKLDFLPNVSFTEGEYVIELRVANGGGRVLYNLYVE